MALHPTTLWHDHYRPILVTVALITLLIWVLILTQPRRLVEGVWTVKLAGCYLDYHTPIHAVALACPGVDYTRLWPLPVEQPWQEPMEGSCTSHEADHLSAGYARGVMGVRPLWRLG
jgi:hypothetical protein